LFVVLASLAVSLFLGGLRQEILDRFLYGTIMKIDRPPTDESRLTQPDVLAAVRFASDNLYRYYQFYSNMAVAITVAYSAWLIQDWGWSWWRVGGLALLTSSLVVLLMSATYSLKRYYKALGEILVVEGGDGE
jgi:hypothetical protein